jgi:hypothetical protein
VDVTGTRAVLTVILASALLAAPLPAEAQRRAVPTVGILDNGVPAARAHLWEAFRQAMRELGYVEAGPSSPSPGAPTAGTTGCRGSRPSWSG